jgi:hypothetical protein
MKLDDYQKFVTSVTSIESKSLHNLEGRLMQLDNKVNIATLLTAGIGLSSEGGEFNEIIKKCVFQGKPLDDDTIFHLKREKVDILAASLTHILVKTGKKETYNEVYFDWCIRTICNNSKCSNGD